MSDINELPDAEYVNLFTFYLPDVTGPGLPSRGQSYYYTNHYEDLEVQGDTFTSEPSIEIGWNTPIKGDAEACEFSIQARKMITPLVWVIEPYPVGRIRIEVREMIPGQIDSLRTVITGDAVGSRSRRDPNNPLVTLQCKDFKRLIEQASELSCLSTCTWKFGSDPCQFDLDASTVGITNLQFGVSAYPNRVSATIDSSPDLSPIRWKRGYIRNNSNGARVTVRNLVDSDVTGPFPILLLDLKKMIPASWATDDLDLVPGCDKGLTACKVHGQEEHFGAFGTGMPGYNPTFYSN
jgi:hypothetical protein